MDGVVHDEENVDNITNRRSCSLNSDCSGKIAIENNLNQEGKSKLISRGDKKLNNENIELGRIAKAYNGTTEKSSIQAIDHSY